jgi:hypothetical protein
VSNDNYPAGVTDAHPHFNPQERPVTVDCTSDEAMVVPVTLVQDRLEALRKLVMDPDATITAVLFQLGHTAGTVDRHKKEGTYECDWTGELELPVSEEAEWTCPRCGVTQTSDTILEDEDLDPDRAYDEMRDARYDD